MQLKLTVRELRELLAGLPSRLPVYVPTLAGEDMAAPHVVLIREAGGACGAAATLPPSGVMLVGRGADDDAVSFLDCTCVACALTKETV
jgi:hypothetical protein